MSGSILTGTSIGFPVHVQQRVMTAEGCVWQRANLHAMVFPQKPRQQAHALNATHWRYESHSLAQRRSIGRATLYETKKAPLLGSKVIVVPTSSSHALALVRSAEPPLQAPRLPIAGLCVAVRVFAANAPQQHHPFLLVGGAVQLLT